MLSKADADAVRSQNRRLALDHFRRFPVSTRRGLSGATGLSFSAASAITSDLLRETVLAEVETGDAKGRRGRPEISLAINGAAATVLILKISVGEIAAAVADYAGTVLAKRARELDLPTLSANGVLAALLQLVESARGGAPAGAGPLRNALVSVQGVTDACGRRILWSPILRLRNVELAGPLEDALGVPVLVLNDCGLMPEGFRWGREIDAPSFATLLIGFGVGMGLRLGGTTFRGARSSAVEFGHLNHVPGGDLCRCGNRGCIEAYAGDYAIWRAARGPSPQLFDRRVRDEDMRALFSAARGGESAARVAVERAGEAIGYGLGRMFTLIDPVPVVFVGPGAEAMDLLEPAVRRGIAESAIEGVGADTPFLVVPDVDALLTEASITLALATVDETASTAAWTAEPIRAS